jgi:hypothetical protein
LFKFFANILTKMTCQLIKSTNIEMNENVNIIYITLSSIKNAT